MRTSIAGPIRQGQQWEKYLGRDPDGGDGGLRHVGPDSLLVAKRPGSHPIDLTVLYGRRLVVAHETDEGSQLAEATVKAITGSDTIMARGMHENYYQFAPLIRCG